MSENGVAELAQIISVSTNTFSTAVRGTVGGVKELYKLLSMMMVGVVKGGQWKTYHKTRGKTNVKNFQARTKGDTRCLKLDYDTYKEIQKILRKSGVLWMEMPMLKKAKNKDSIHIMFGACDEATVINALNQAKEERIKKEVKKGKDETAARKEFDDLNSMESISDMLYETGATETSMDSFQKELREYAKDSYDFKKEDRLPGFRKEEVQVIGKKLRNREPVIQRLEQKIQPVKYSFQDGSDSHVIRQTDTHVMVQLKESQEFGVWLPKDSIYPPLSEPCKGTRTAFMKEEEMVIVSLIQSNEDMYSSLNMSAKVFDEKMREYAKQSKEEAKSRGQRDIKRWNPKESNISRAPMKARK